MSRFKYAPLLVIQIGLMILFFVFVQYGEPRKAKGFEGTHVMIFIGFGFLMTFLKKYCYSALGFNWLLASIVVQWSILCQNFFHMDDGVIHISKYQILEADIMAATVLITFGAVLGIASGPQLIVIALIETALASVNLHLVLETLTVADAGGSIGVHAFGAYFGLACSYALNLRKETKESAELNDASYISDITATIGSIFLWIYWPSFNSAIVTSVTEYERAILNTYLALASATVTTFMMSSLVNEEKGKFDMVHVQNSTLAGGVAVGAVANMIITPGGALAIGIGAGILSVLGYHYLSPKLDKVGILDTCGVNNLHGMPALLSGLLSALFAYLATSKDYGSDMVHVFPGMVGSDGRSSTEQALYQLAGLGATVGIALVGGFLTGLIARIPIFKPLTEEELYNDEGDWGVPE